MNVAGFFPSVCPHYQYSNTGNAPPARRLIHAIPSTKCIIICSSYVNGLAVDDDDEQALLATAKHRRKAR